MNNYPVVTSLRNCADCTYCYFGAHGSYCVAFAEFIDDEERAARDCPLWDPALPRRGAP